MFRRKKSCGLASKSKKLFHGTTVDFDRVCFRYSYVPADFGLGFYMTDDMEKAKFRAREKALDLGLDHYYVIEYVFLDNLARLGGRMLELERNLEWIRFVITCRLKDMDMMGIDPDKRVCYQHGYSVVTGPSADGGNLNRIVEDYIGVDLTEDVLRDLDSRFGNSPYGKQYAICSERDVEILLRKVRVYEFSIND